MRFALAFIGNAPVQNVGPVPPWASAQPASSFWLWPYVPSTNVVGAEHVVDRDRVRADLGVLLAGVVEARQRSVERLVRMAQPEYLKVPRSVCPGLIVQAQGRLPAKGAFDRSDDFVVEVLARPPACGWAADTSSGC